MVTPQCIHGAVSDWLIAVTLDTLGDVNSRRAGLEPVEGDGGGDESPNMDGDADAILSDGA
jgi:hypothetical protein